MKKFLLLTTLMLLTSCKTAERPVTELQDISFTSDCSYIYTEDETLSVKLPVEPIPDDATGYTLSYASDNPHITIDENGTVKSDGTPVDATVTVTYGAITKTHGISVIDKVESFSLSQSEISLFADRPEPVTLSVVCDENFLKYVTWYSDNESIAYVDNGTVIPNGVGTTSIYAQMPDGKYTAKCTVYVGLYDVSIRSVFITNAIDKVRIGEEYKLSAYVYPEIVKDKTVIWTSSDSNILSVDRNGTVHGIASGTARLTAETTNGKTDSFDITVVPQSDTSGYKIVSKSVSERIAALSGTPEFKSYSYTLADITERQMLCEPQPVHYDDDRAAEYGEVYNALNPQSNASGYGKYQFIDLSHQNGIDIDTLNRYLHGKGVLEGKGVQFKEAADRYKLSELYLVTHACLESGSGTSKLATGVDVNGTVVYNVFGIGAYDAGAVKYGSEYAYNMGWTSVDAAIDGGARWISENYINNTSYRQNTLYKMRWNPDSPGEHQYATDINWAKAQAEILKTMFDAFPTAELNYEIPLYNGEKEFELR